MSHRLRVGRMDGLERLHEDVRRRQNRKDTKGHCCRAKWWEAVHWLQERCLRLQCACLPDRLPIFDLGSVDNLHTVLWPRPEDQATAHGDSSAARRSPLCWKHVADGHVQCVGVSYRLRVVYVGVLAFMYEDVRRWREDADATEAERRKTRWEGMSWRLQGRTGLCTMAMRN